MDPKTEYMPDWTTCGVCGLYRPRGQCTKNPKGCIKGVIDYIIQKR